METPVEITLEELLQSRDDRAAFQTILLNGYHRPLVSFTVNMPGKVKRDARSRTVFEAGVHAIREALAGQIVYYKLLDKNTGPEGYFAVDMDALDLKEKMVSIEETHPLGRLMDIDVIAADGTPVGREALGLPPRRCLLCDKEVRLCMRARTHTPEELLDRIRQMVNDYEHGI